MLKAFWAFALTTDALFVALLTSPDLFTGLPKHKENSDGPESAKTRFVSSNAC